MDTSKGLENIDGVVWFDGQYVDWKDAKVHVLTHTLHYGLGVFEGVRAYSTMQGPTIFRLHKITPTSRMLNLRTCTRNKRNVLSIFRVIKTTP